MRTLAFDMGRYTGWAVVEDAVLIEAQEVDLGEDDHQRYATFARLYRRLAAQFNPDIVAYEHVTFAGDGPGTMIIQSCRGIVEAETGLAGLLCVPVNVMTAKKVIAGTGKATKDEMRSVMLTMIPELALVQKVQPGKKYAENATDAVAVALTADSMVIATAQEA